MLHETNNKKITVEDMTVDFQSVYREEYFPKDLYGYIDVEKSDELHSKNIFKLFPQKDKVLITKKILK